MRKNLQAIALLRSFSTGIITPVFTLMLLARGATIGNVSLLVGAYSLTVIAAEFPTGVFADLCGRKLSYVVATLFSIACYALLLFSHSVLTLLAVLVLNALGRAFASGSLDALAIDEAADDAALVKVTARLSVLESAGLAAGALVGGLLAGIGTGYAANIATVLALMAPLLLLTLVTVRETPRAPDKAHQEGSRLREHVRECLVFARRPGIVRMVLLFSLCTGFAMFTIEIYWQPAFIALSSASWLLGAVTFAGFGSVMIGNKLTERWLTKSPKAGVALMLAQRALMGVFVLPLMLSRQATPFIASYILAYLFLGGSSVAESALLNREAPAKQRASILSLFSFVVQIGGLIASGCGYVIGAYADYRLVWLVAGGLLLGLSGVYAAMRATRFKQSVPD